MSTCTCKHCACHVRDTSQHCGCGQVIDPQAEAVIRAYLTS